MRRERGRGGGGRTRHADSERVFQAGEGCLGCRSWCAGIGRNTVQRFEDNQNVYLDKVLALERAYEEAGVQLTGKTGAELPDSEGE